MDERIAKDGAVTLFDAENFLANYAGDMTLTPDGLHFLGVVPRETVTTPFRRDEPVAVYPKRRAV